jgi:hypothetical protein
MRPMLANRRIEQALLMNYGSNADKWLASISARANLGVNIPGQVVNDAPLYEGCSFAARNSAAIRPYVC